MSSNKSLINISLDRYVELIENETKIDILKREALRTEYSVDREFVATVIGFELPKKETKSQGGEF